ncbi:hypothetical protein DPQ33_10165 [Oceanidesulfovibrio indonesiensis]|uniref:Uncharacterized protein n=1 Tax=Oceanidesulfovibrio indonesiensis TaxID=54767 RepID=A0A7M3MF19_9BACT|nr:hypothetical protein [Oceanidesulfovibrio indonesiensis]TVM17147.1 hypothetical protein DPQ33_10165 [Oceanidesulfovibrio indonesiensis]
MSFQISLLFQQMPLVGQVAGAEMSAPEAQAAAASHMAFEALRKQREQVPGADKPENVKADFEAGAHGGGARHGTRRRRKKPEPEEPAEDQGKTPWSGNIINRNI